MATLLRNRRARFDFDILDEFEGGLVLAGHEVKSLRTGRGKLEGSYVLIRGGEAYLVGASITPYQVANTPKEYDPERPRKLLLSKKELGKLERATEQERQTAVPLAIYEKGRTIKLGFATARGKKKTDKRESIKRRDVGREIERETKFKMR